ncbi:MAG: hypothetical protein M1838_002552 [Thelocarpon superellum]|nr:MAG: hypothetical protein M1838_002552 [Thelocarpon superellum]
MSIPDEQSPVREDISKINLGISKLIQERDELRVELTYAKLVVADLRSQRARYVDLLQSLSITLQLHLKSIPWSPSTARFSLLSPTPVWIRDIWLVTSDNHSCLGHAEHEWTHSNNQRAIALISKQLLNDNLPNQVRINAHLLMCVILRDCNQTNAALAHGGEALRLATKYGYFQLQGKAQMYRGICYFSIERYPEAIWLLTLGGGTKPFGDKIKAWRTEAEQKLASLPKDHPHKYMAPDFDNLPPDRPGAVVEIDRSSV